MFAIGRHIRVDIRRSLVSGLPGEERGLPSRTAAGNRGYRFTAVKRLGIPVNTRVI